MSYPPDDLRGLTGAMGKKGLDRPIAVGLAANRPAANLITPNSFYFAVDTRVLSYSNGVSWSTISAGSMPKVGDFKISAQTADHADPSGTGTWYIMNATTALPVNETQLIALIGANRIDMRGRMPVIIGTHADVNGIGDNDGTDLASRRPSHDHTVNLTATAAGGHAHGGFQAVSPTGGTGGTGYTGGDRADVTITDAIGNHTHPVSGVVGVGGTAPVDKPAFGVVGHGFYYGSGA